MSTGLFTNAFLGSMGYGGGSRSPAINLTSVSSGSNGNWVALFPNSISPNYSATGTQALYNGSGGVWLAASESSGTGYTAGGQALVSQTWAETATPGVIAYSAASVSWTTSTIANARYALIYSKDASNAAIIAVDFSVGSGVGAGGYSTAGTTFTINWSGAGIFTWQVHT